MGFSYRIINIETIQDIAMLIGWSTALIINFIGSVIKKDQTRKI